MGVRKRLTMKKVEKKKILNRMNYLLGHLKGVCRMIQEDKYCIDIINQNQGVISALQKVNQKILRRHLDSCIVKAVESKSKSKRKKVFDEITEVFKAAQ